MKKILFLFGFFLIVLITAGIIGFSYLVVTGNKLDKESKIYIDEIIPIILTNLNKETLFQYASDELKNSLSPKQLENIFATFGKLGHFKKYKESKGQANISLTTKNKQITGYYEANTEFENGPATVKITIIKKMEQWQILVFDIHSIAFSN